MGKSQVTPLVTSLVLLVLVINLSSFVLAAHVQPYVVNLPEDDESTSTTHRPLLGQKHCTYGPSYWCHNITQAKECSAVTHCVHHVWENMRVPDDNDDVCTICKEMVKEARDQLLSNETQDELRQVLEGSCNLIPLKVVAHECCKLADDFIPELVDALSSRMDPITVCTVSGLCNSERIDAMLREMKPMKPEKKSNFDLKTDSCPKCTHFMGKAVDTLKHLNRDQLRLKLFEICGYVGSYSDSCRAIITREFDTIYEHIQSDMQPTEMCGLVGLCSVVSIHPVRIQTESTGVRVWSPPPKNQKDDDVECDFCKQLVDHVRQWMTANTTRDEFHKIIVGLCQQTGKYRQECVGLADQYAGPLYDFIVNEMDPQEVCSEIGVCQSPSGIQGRVKLFSSASSAGPIWTLLKPGEGLAGDDEANAHRRQDQDFSLLMMKLVPGESLAGEDEGNAILLETNSIPKEKQQQQLVKDILPTCPLCTFTVNKLIELIGKNYTKESIDHATEEVCYHIPARYKDSCLTFMKEYGDRVMEMILIEGTAHEICAALHLCLWSSAPVSDQARTRPSMTVVVQSPLPFERYVPQLPSASRASPNVGQKQTCVLCEFIMTQLDGMLKDNSTEEEIKDTVEHVCDYLPKTVRPQCRAFVEEYGDMIITYLAQSLDPQQICTEIKLCDPTTSLGQDTIDIRTIQIDDSLQLDRCELCVLIADYLSAFLDDPNFDSDVDKLVERVCPHLPKDYQQDCKNMIEDYGPYLMSLLAQETDKGKICTVINLCPAQ